MRYYFKKYRLGKRYTVSCTDKVMQDYRIFDLEEHKAIAFVQSWRDAIFMVNCVSKLGAIIF